MKYNPVTAFAFIRVFDETLVMLAQQLPKLPVCNGLGHKQKKTQRYYAVANPLRLLYLRRSCSVNSI